MTQPDQTITPPSTISDETLRRFLGYHMKRAFNVVQADLTATLKPFDLRMLTYTALVLICDNAGLSQAQLAAAMDIERPNLVVIIDELERRELINRTRVPTDRRTYALIPTLAGRRLCDQAVAAVEAHEAKLFAGLDDEMRAAMVAILSKVRGT
ncbi:MarR family transcriptional regulator [Aliiroseovarius sp.]|uniref:MarR family winged helix-turn-helix transcriptional regulator n=1 Tax=Aliiroseovarius sp. TaxID=1872442 RepID=UPI002617B463|nr:MarR family transcriptional regulator [Aliiroseovarius sp.]